MPPNSVNVVAPTSYHIDKNIKVTERIRLQDNGMYTISSGQQEVGSNGKRRRSRDAERGDSALSRRSVLGKRNRLGEVADGRESYPVAKRPYRPSLSSPNNRLCDDCAEICWDGIEKIVIEKLRFTWKGRPVVDVGRRYRKLSPDNTCTLCRQLHAPWIEQFLENRRWIEGKVIPDVGDRIHVFPNLQYIHHISDFQSGRNVLRAHDAPYHIAVVPIAPRWKEGLLQHMATRGMVVVLPDERPESKILQPQQIPQEFDPKPVRSWLKTCRRHRSRCNPKAPEVKGMRVIDCKSEHLKIRDHQPGDEYVALSYVWGSSFPSGSTDQTDASARRPRDTKRILKFPKNVPLTIRDAIEVTRALRYRYLWVDKYCIDQHNEDEKREQFSRMGDIYAGSQVAIFALGDDSDAGLPGVSSTPRLAQEECRSGLYRFISTMPDPHEFIKWSKWSTRAWTYQEGLFSTRRLFFTNHQVYFECNAMNCTESFKSDLDVIHTNNGQRFRAYHRAGQFVCGNSSSYSHLDVRRNQANHRKVDMLRRCQHQITQYTRRELTNKDDALHAFAAIARFYAKTTAMIASLAGIPIPFPIANLPASRKQEGLDHLAYALAWSHEVDNFDERFPRRYYYSQVEKQQQTPRDKIVGGSKKARRFQQQQHPWTPERNPKPQCRDGFPSWSWAGWFGQVRSARDHLPYCWMSLLSSVQIGFLDGGHVVVKDYDYIHGFERYKAYFIRELLAADTLHFDAYVLSPQELASRLVAVSSSYYSNDGTSGTTTTTTNNSVDVSLSTGPTSLEEFRARLLLAPRREEQGYSYYYQCVVLGTYGQPRRDVYRAIQVQDKKRGGAKKRRIELFERSEPDAIVCLVVRTDSATGVSYREGLLKVRYYTGRGGEHALRGWDIGEKKRFILK